MFMFQFDYITSSVLLHTTPGRAIFISQRTELYITIAMRASDYSYEQTILFIIILFLMFLNFGSVSKW
jgi:hypothetical protein